jgi:hypothetical protein
MSITFINVATRPDTSEPFYADSNLPHITFQKNLNSPGATRTSETSTDGLRRTVQTTFSTIEDFSTFYNYIADLNLSVEFNEYRENNPGHDNTRSVSGDIGKFTMTSVYDCPNGTDIADSSTPGQTIVDRLRNSDTAHLTNIEVLTNKITVTHTYENVADFSSRHFNDVLFAADLVNAGVTKTVTITAA